MEDTDLALLARLAGWIRCTSGEHRYHDYALKMFPLKVYYQERNRYVMLLKSLRWPTLLVMLPALLAAEAITWGFVLLYDRGNVKNKLLAVQWLMSNWWTIMESRRAAQATRRGDRELFAHTSLSWIRDAKEVSSRARAAVY